MKSNIDHPSHYNKGGIETIDIIVDKNMDFFIGNIVKYVSRYKHKNGLEDLGKAMWYLNRYIKETLNRCNNMTIGKYLPVKADSKISLTVYVNEQRFSVQECNFLFSLYYSTISADSNFLDSLKEALKWLIELITENSTNESELTVINKLIHEAEDNLLAIDRLGKKALNDMLGG